MKVLKVSIVFVFAVFTFLAAYYNQSKDVDVNLFGKYLQCPLWLIISVFFLLGLIASQIVCIIDDIRYTNKIKEYKKQIKQLKDEVVSLRKLTVTNND